MFFGKKVEISTIEKCLKEKGWKYLKVDDNTIFTGTGTPTGRFYGISVRLLTEKQTVLFLFNPLKRRVDILEAIGTGSGFLKFHANEGHSSEIVAHACEILSHWNFGLVLGNFERDQTDGEIRYRVAVPYRDGQLTCDQFHWCIVVSIGTMDMLLPKLEALVEGRLSFEEVLGEGRPEGPRMV